jgi:hypothetical protein
MFQYRKFVQHIRQGGFEKWSVFLEAYGISSVEVQNIVF